MKQKTAYPTIDTVKSLQNKILMLQVFMITMIIAGFVYLGHVFTSISLLFYGAAIVMGIVYLGGIMIFLSARKQMDSFMR